MLLKDCKHLICVNAGHFVNDTGALGMAENNEVMKVRDFLVPKLREQGFEVVSIPDNLNLVESIKMVNMSAKTLYDGVAIDIHFNKRGSLATNQRVGGTEVYSGTSILSRRMSGVISECVAKELGVLNRGYRPHTWASCGSLGWITDTLCWSFVLECLYIDDPMDRLSLSKDGHEKIAIGITKSMCKLFGVSYINLRGEEEEKIKKLTRIAWLMEVVVSLYMKIRKLKSNQSNRLLSGLYEILK